MSNLKAVAFSLGGAPKILSDEDSVRKAIAQGQLTAASEVTVYSKDGSSRFGRCDSHDELVQFFPRPAPETELQPDAAAPEGEGQSVLSQAEKERIVNALNRRDVSAASSPTAEEARAPSQIWQTRPATGPKPELAAIEARMESRNAQRSGVGANTGAIDPSDFWEAAWLPMQRYAQFTGRARRMEYWSFTVMVWATLLVLAGISGTDTGLFAIAVLALMVPSLAVQVRRLHDVGLSGWLVLPVLILGLGSTALMIIGSIALTIICFLDSKPGTNAYGPNPKGT